jgi:hypothetical protein
MQQKPIRAFTFTYREVAKANIAPIRAVTCEGVEASDGTVAMRTPDKQWHLYNKLDEMFEDFGRHGKGKIRFIPPLGDGHE